MTGELIVKNKPFTIYDIARTAGVSVGTVNRALHNKSQISEETRERVLKIATEMNFKVNHIAQSLGRKPRKIGALLVCPVKEFLNDVKNGVESAFLDLIEYNIIGDIRVIDTSDGYNKDNEITGCLSDFMNNKYDGVVALTSGNNEQYIKELLKLRKAGIPVSTITNDIAESKRLFHVGMDGECAGRMAAQMLWLLCKNKKVALLTGSIETEIHKRNIVGFNSFAKIHNFNKLIIYKHHDKSEYVIEQTELLLKEHPDLDGIYITSASSLSICGYLHEKGIKSINIIATDLFTETRALIESGFLCATIFQDPYKQGYDSVQYMYKHITNLWNEHDVKIIPQLVMLSNIDLYE